MTAGLIIAVVLIVLIAYGFFKAKSQINKPVSAKVKILNDANFQTTISQGISLVDCWAEWCQPCKIMNPVISDLADEIGDTVNICKLNVDHNNSTAARYGIRSIPTILIFKDGVEVNRLVGVKPKGFLLAELKKAGL